MLNSSRVDPAAREEPPDGVRAGQVHTERQVPYILLNTEFFSPYNDIVNKEPWLFSFYRIEKSGLRSIT